jgi:hypothetical protein
MSLSENKKNVFTTIGSYTSFSNNENVFKLKNTYSSVNNKKEVIPFLIEAIKVSVGSESIKLLVGELLTKFLDNAEIKSKNILKSQFIDANSDKQVSNTFKTTGYKINANKIDIYKKFRNPITSESYQLFRNDTILNFENSMYDSIRLEPTEINHNNIIKVSYDKLTDEFIFKSYKSDYLVKDFVNDYIDNTTIINKKEIHSNIMNLLFGTISNYDNKTVTEITNELDVDQLLSQIINNDEVFEDNSENILKKAEDIVNGNCYYDLGCGNMKSILSINDLKTLISEISGSTDSFSVANKLELILENNSNLDLNIYNENKQTIKDNYFKQLIDYFVLNITKSLTISPQIRTLIGITNSFKNNLTSLDGKYTDSILESKSLISCIIKDLISQISEFIYKKAVSFIIEIIKPILKKILKEKLVSYNRIIKSLNNPLPI